MFIVLTLKLLRHTLKNEGEIYYVFIHIKMEETNVLSTIKTTVKYAFMPSVRRSHGQVP